MAKRIVSTLLLILFLIPIPIGTTEAASFGQISDGPIIDMALSAELVTLDPSEMIPIFVSFPEESAPSLMKAEVEKLCTDNAIVRHVFHLIPIVSLYATRKDIESLAKSKLAISVGLDKKRSAISTSENETIIAGAGNLGYVHFDSILAVDQLWAEGYNGIGVVVAVLDTGVWGDHPDLEDRLIGFKDYINGRTDMDPVGGINAYDDNGHGTACAWNAVGTGVQNGGTYRGTSPGASLLGVKVLDDEGAGEDTVIAEAIEFAVDQNVDIISLSLGGEWTDGLVLDPTIVASKAAVAAGVSVVVAAGNSGPAAYTMNSPGVAEEVITVGSSSRATGIAGFSSRGPVSRIVSSPKGVFAKPDLVVPGLNVMSGRWNNPLAVEFPPYNSSQFGAYYVLWSGTSSSAPIAAGLVAILKQKYPNLTPLEAKAALMLSSTDLLDDPMAQGWGLPNVTLAAQLLEGSSPLALASPRRFPTLPASSTVLLIGEERHAQNITIISTEDIGNAQILCGGNASQYIELSKSNLTVSLGYSYFSISLKIPDDLPLSAAGRYTGEVNLTSVNDITARIDLNFTITAFGGRLMVDMSHHASDDIDDTTQYRYFTEYLREQGILLAEYGSAESISPDRISSAELGSSDAFLIMDTELTYTTDEIDALHSFVERGGTLLAFSEFFDESTNTAAFAIDSYNQILAPYGIQCERKQIGGNMDDDFGRFYGVDYGGVVESDPLVDGVTNLYIFLGSTLSVDPSIAGARGLFWLDSEKTHALVAAVEHGKGHVIAVSDGSTLYDDMLFDAIRGGGDNLRLLRNIAGSVFTVTPRIYDVVLNTGEIGEGANLAAYVFDEDLDQVQITLRGPDGSEIPITLSESLGYKFTATFTLESSGFHDIFIEATDLENNIRIFQKMILVPAALAEEALIWLVMGSLLIVCGFALAYVLLRRLTARRKPIYPSEPEWEPQWETDEAPPSIQ